MDQLALIGCVAVLVTIYCSDVNGQGSTTFDFVNFGEFIAPENGVLIVVENSTVTPPSLSVDVICQFEAVPSDYSPRSPSDESSLWSRDGSPIMNLNPAGNALNVTTVVTSDSRTARIRSNLLLPPAITVDLAGTYTCNVTSHTMYFVLHVAVRARIENAFEDVNVTRGNTISLPCNSSGDVPVIKVWYKDGVVVQNTTTTTFRDDIPLLLSGDRSDTATYTCNVTNQFGNQSSAVGVTVQEAPYFTGLTAPSSGDPTQRTFPVTLQPVNNGNSPILSYTVVCRPQTPRYAGLANVNMSYSTLIFEVTGLQPGATYDCAYFATNSIGNGNESSFVSVSLLPDIPGPPVITDVINVTSTSVNVTYMRPGIMDQNGDPIGYTLSYDYLDCNTPDGRCPCETYNCRLNGSATISNSGESGSYLLMGLRRYTTYNVSLRTTNGFGTGGPRSMMVTTPEDRPGPPSVMAAPISSTAIRVNWSSPREPNGIITGYTLSYRMADGGNLTAVNLNDSSLTYNITNETANTFYIVSVAAMTSVGVGMIHSVNESTGAAPIIDVSTTMYRFDAFQNGDLPCNIIQGRPAPVITWTTPDVGMWATGANGALQFRPTPINATGTYICTASNEYGNVSHTVTLQVVHNASITIGSRVLSTNLTGEGLYTVTCTATAFPLSSRDVKWLGVSVQSSNSAISTMADGTMQVVSTAFVPGNDNYSCQVRQPDIVAKSIPVNWMAPTVNTFTSSAPSVDNGGNTTLLCHATGSPYPRVRIYQNGNLLSAVRPILNADTVEANITVFSGGLFLCVADNRAGQNNETLSVSSPEESTLIPGLKDLYLWIIVGCVGGLLLLVVIICICRRRKSPSYGKTYRVRDDMHGLRTDPGVHTASPLSTRYGRDHAHQDAVFLNDVALHGNDGFAESGFTGPGQDQWNTPAVTNSSSGLGTFQPSNVQQQRQRSMDQPDFSAQGKVYYDEDQFYHGNGEPQNGGHGANVYVPEQTSSRAGMLQEGQYDTAYDGAPANQEALPTFTARHGDHILTAL